jgi:predicted RNA-binding protein YlqC (UPF0109 family)
LTPDTDVSTVADGRESAMEEMLLFVVRSLVDHPEDVEVEFLSDEEGEVFQVLAHQSDLGRLIGKNGQTAKALELILNANGKKIGRRYHLDIVGTEDVRDTE